MLRRSSTPLRCTAHSLATSSPRRGALKLLWVQVIQTRLAIAHQHYRGIFDAAAQISATEGRLAFFRCVCMPWCIPALPDRLQIARKAGQAHLLGCISRPAAIFGGRVVTTAQACILQLSCAAVFDGLQMTFRHSWAAGAPQLRQPASSSMVLAPPTEAAGLPLRLHAAGCRGWTAAMAGIVPYAGVDIAVFARLHSASTGLSKRL